MIKAVMLYAANRDFYLPRAYPQEVRAELEKNYAIFDSPINETEFDRYEDVLKETEAIFCSWWMPELSEQTIRHYLPKLKVLFYAAGSVQYFARPFLASGVCVVSGWAANGTPVAEYAAAQIILANKGFFQNGARMQADYKMARAFSDHCPGNYHTNVGILGAGAVGSRVISLLNAYALNIWVYDPFLTKARANELGVETHSLEDIFSSCSVISNHVAQLPATEGMIGYELLSQMQSYSVLLNTGRGSQIVEADLVRAMHEDLTRTAVLDVTDPEPPAENSPLYGLPNILLTTHIAGSMGREIGRIGAYIAEEAAALANGMPLRYKISLDALKTMA